MTVTVYRSSDAGAPNLTGQIGSVIAILDACLVNGYGAKAAAGWAKEFSDVNLAVYRAPVGNRMRLRVDDTSAIEARVLGYEVMTSINVGTGPFPTAAQASGGLYIRKSETTDGTVRSWLLIATNKLFMFLPHTGGADWLAGPIPNHTSGYTLFGEFNSFKVGDAYNTLLIASSVTGASQCRLGFNHIPGTGSAVMTGHYVPRGYDQLGTSKQVAKRAVHDPSLRSPFGVSTLPAFPDAVTGDMIISPIGVLEDDSGGRNVWRGLIPGFWAPLHALPGAHGDTIVGNGTTAGLNFMLFNVGESTTAGRALLEISDTW